jgi:hypothetical protein
MEQDAAAARDAGDTEEADRLEALAPGVVPTGDQIENTYTDKQMDEEEEAQWNELWLDVYVESS